MGSSIVSQQGLQFALPQNQQVPDEGPKAIPLLLNFANAAQFTLDLTNLEQRAFISMIQTLYIDASQTDDPTTITIEGTNQVVIAAAKTQGYYPVLCPNPPRFKFANASGSDIINIFLVNAPISGVVWSV